MNNLTSKTIIELSKNMIKWDNHLGEKAIFLYKHNSSYIYLVKNSGNSYFAIFHKTGFEKIEDPSFLNASEVIQTIVMNFNKRISDINNRKVTLVDATQQLLTLV
ncbi:hypothetical protein [Clostridium baratii]|uniref:hypothetical protein n=1 Tax=Clostridium baratii TaxID=1561 RepID=UPI0005F2F8FF|nr:hypothetical protein [Clostridium baratii]AQM58605.1 hypothetical protein NPD11_3048 [Clostridium baratii]KJU71564.1 hypothetical protein UC77_09120 [Clostridium baratii]